MKMFTRLFLLTFVLFSAAPVVCQDWHKIDSLEKLYIKETKTAVNTAAESKSRVNLLCDIGTEFLAGNTDSSMYYAEKARILAIQAGYKIGEGNATRLMGIAREYMGEFMEAQMFYRKALDIFEKAKDYRMIANSYNDIGIIYEEFADYPEALGSYFNALRLFIKIKDKNGQASVMPNIGNVYSNIDSLDKAIEYYLKSISILKGSGKSRGLDGIYTDLASCYASQNKHSLAKEYYLKALYMRIADNNLYGLSNSYQNLGNFYSSIKSYDTAILYTRRSLQISDSINDENGKAWAWHHLGSIHYELNNYAQAIDLEKLALDVVSLTGSQNLKKKILLNLSHNYEKLGNYKTAYQYRLQYELISDTLFSTESNDRMKNLVFQHKFQKTQDSLEAIQIAKDLFMKRKVEQKTRMLYLSILGLLLLAVSTIVFLRQRNNISKSKKLADDLLLNILPAEVAEELKLTGGAEAKSFDNTTVLFSDFQEFTQYSEKISAEKLVSELNHCFKAFDAITSKYFIEKIKTIGDSYMAAAGFGHGSQDAATNAVKAALEMQFFIANLKNERDLHGEESFQMRIGIHTGPIVAGIVGVKKFAYDIWGDTVNTASRMESSGTVGKVNISESTYEIIKNNPLFAFESRGKIQVKGKGEIQMYFVSWSNHETP